MPASPGNDPDPIQPDEATQARLVRDASWLFWLAAAFLFTIPHKVEPNWGGGPSPPLPTPTSEYVRVVLSLVVGLAPVLSIVWLSRAEGAASDPERRKRIGLYRGLVLAGSMLVVWPVILYKSVYCFI